MCPWKPSFLEAIRSSMDWTEDREERDLRSIVGEAEWKTLKTLFYLKNHIFELNAFPPFHIVSQLSPSSDQPLRHDGSKTPAMILPTGELFKLDVWTTHGRQHFLLCSNSIKEGGAKIEE